MIQRATVTCMLERGKHCDTKRRAGQSDKSKVGRGEQIRAVVQPLSHHRARHIDTYNVYLSLVHAPVRDREDRKRRQYEEKRGFLLTRRELAPTSGERAFSAHATTAKAGCGSRPWPGGGDTMLCAVRCAADPVYIQLQCICCTMYGCAYVHNVIRLHMRYSRYGAGCAHSPRSPSASPEGSANTASIVERATICAAPPFPSIDDDTARICN